MVGALDSAACGVAARSDGACVSSTTEYVYGGTSSPAEAIVPEEQARAVGAIEDDAGTLFCTGVIVSRGWVLSAAHCASAQGLYLRLAAFGAEGPRLPLGEPHVDPTTDLVLVELVDADQLDALGIRPLELATATNPADVEKDDTLVLAGVGVTDDGRRGELRFVEEPVSAIDEASISVDGGGRTGACLGDSGGPLLGRDAAGAGVLLGILSKGASSCRGVDIYTRVDSSTAWLEQTEASFTPSRSGTCTPK